MDGSGSGARGSPEQELAGVGGEEEDGGEPRGRCRGIVTADVLSVRT